MAGTKDPRRVKFPASSWYPLFFLFSFLDASLLPWWGFSGKMLQLVASIFSRCQIRLGLSGFGLASIQCFQAWDLIVLSLFFLPSFFLSIVLEIFFFFWSLALFFLSFVSTAYFPILLPVVIYLYLVLMPPPDFVMPTAHTVAGYKFGWGRLQEEYMNNAAQGRYLMSSSDLFSAHSQSREMGSPTPYQIVPHCSMGWAGVGNEWTAECGRQFNKNIGQPTRRLTMEDERDFVCV